TADSWFRDFSGLLRTGDVLVLNNTKVMPSRLIGLSRGRETELLLLNRVEGDCWECLAKPGKRAREGDIISFADELRAVVIAIKPDGNRVARMEYTGRFDAILEKAGKPPLPPYITKTLEDKSRYQTAYARHEGSAAAPTAGFHFTKEYLEEIRAGGTDIAEITLHVGLGTFRPVKTENILEHHMHSEYYNIEPPQADIINRAKERRGRVIAVGTTTCRTLEAAARNGRIVPGSGNTDIFIYPGYEFKIIDALLTNFHLPKSTLIMLVSALAGRESTLAAYERAVQSRYRFFSFGDAMFIS
ncbi:MAG: tRNA preQ1(34) S-adenosylmethionine ribosyltransferase-isomerase QueA, partial [Clostridiales bacterium]|nr:tRNA preQ1(34) S-adenosylmethionine ribosyltransferase-isomerase QueA [Clostridiales bacterium]